MENLGIINAMLDENDIKNLTRIEHYNVKKRQTACIKRIIKRRKLIHQPPVLEELSTIPEHLLSLGLFQACDKNGDTPISIAARKGLLKYIPQKYITTETLMQKVCRRSAFNSNLNFNFNERKTMAAIIAAEFHCLDQISGKLTQTILTALSGSGKNLLNQAITAGEVHHIPAVLLTKEVLLHKARTRIDKLAYGYLTLSGYATLACVGQLKTINQTLLTEEICLQENLLAHALVRNKVREFPDFLITRRTLEAEYNLSAMGKPAIGIPVILKGNDLVQTLGQDCIEQFLTKTLSSDVVTLFPEDWQQEYRQMHKSLTIQDSALYVEMDIF